MDLKPEDAVTRTREENAADLKADEERLEADRHLSVEQLVERYSHEGDGEHWIHTVENWKIAVDNDDTRTGYWAWVWHQLSSDQSL